jgi:hypothetical protein
MIKKQIVSKERVTNHGEVFTQEREVNAMLDLVIQETQRIDSRFLEPACGTGNFLTEILKRKLQVVEDRYKSSQLEYEKYAILAVSSIYGIDILHDNVTECRKRLFDLFDERYTEIFKSKTKTECRRSVKFILEKNIIWGDALSLKTEGENPQPITFAEWSLINNMIKRRDFTMSLLINSYQSAQIELFPVDDLFADFDEEEFIPNPTKDYPPRYFLKLGERDEY